MKLATGECATFGTVHGSMCFCMRFDWLVDVCLPVCVCTGVHTYACIHVCVCVSLYKSGVCLFLYDVYVWMHVYFCEWVGRLNIGHSRKL